MNCPYCGKKARWVSNSIVYGRTYGTSYMIWICTDCDAYVGCHKNTKRPLGTMANKALRFARRKVHEAFDMLWKSKHMTRDEAYAWASTVMGKEFHVGSSTMEDCKNVLRLLDNRGGVR